MTLPAGISSQWILTTYFDEVEYRKAVTLHDAEQYAASNSLLGDLLRAPLATTSGTVPAIDVLKLFGWNLQNQMEYVQLERFLKNLPDGVLAEYPDLMIVHLRLLVQKGQCQEALAICEGLEPGPSGVVSEFVSELLYVKSMALYKLGRLAECVRDLELSYALYKLQRNEKGAALAGNYLGFVQSRLSDYRESIKWLSRSLPYYEETKLARRQSMVHLNIGITHYKVGDYEAAFSHLRKSHQIGLDGNWPHRQCFANIALGNVYRLTRDFESARKHLHTAYKQAQELQFPREEALALEFLGDVYRDEGAPMEARRFYARAMAIGLRIAPEGDIVMETHRRIGECLNLEGDQGAAMASLNKALEMAKAQGDRFEAAVTLRVMCETATNTGDLKSARRCIDESVRTLQEIEARHEWAISLFVSATLKLQEVENPRAQKPRIVRLNEAWKQATQALDLFIKVDVPWWTTQGRALVSRVSAVRNAQERADKEALTSGKSTLPGGYLTGDVIVHQSSVMRDVLQLCDMFAGTGEPVLITGETGTGKEIVAKRLHQHSERADGPLVIVNVAAIPETMFEREFFGHVRGAFSGATHNGDGFAARANGGTLFLDEIGDLPLDLQPKLLRLLQEGTYQALGDPQQRHTDLRLLAATNADLEQKVKQGRFRADLYYRLRILDLPLPAVRDRSEDILPLMRHFLCVAAKRTVDLSEYFNRPSLEAIESYEWPGNVREIAMIARQAHVALQAFGRVDLKLRRNDQPDLRLAGPGLLAAAEADGGETSVAAAVTVNQSEAAERARILLALDEAGGSRNLAAQALGIGRSTLYRKMEKYGIPTRRD